MKKLPGGQIKDLSGKTFGHLKVISFYGIKNRYAYWNVECVCGKVYARSGGELTRKRSKDKHCGCLRGSLVAKRNLTHGMSLHPVWNVWYGMRKRCSNPKNEGFKHYGGRGIKVCKRWLNSFENFWEDMGGTYKEGLQLDRKKNNKGYSKSNCRWVTCRVNINNRRRTIFVNTEKGRMPLSEACELFGINYMTGFGRYTKGWPEDLLFIKPDTRNKILPDGKYTKARRIH